jgi:DNA-binding response OmpR family regulator
MTDRNTLKVLVAEDEPAMLSLVARHLRRLGFSVTEASDGDAAWEVAQQVLPDLVLLDVMMPGMSGWEVCKHLKGDDFSAAPFRKTGVVMLTGIGDNLNEMTSPLFEADAWLNKPFYFPDLERKIRETLAKYGHTMPVADLEDDEDASAEEEASMLDRNAPTRRAPAGRRPAPKKATPPSTKKAEKPAAKKAAAKKAAPKKAAKKAAPKKAAAKKPAAKKAAAKKPAPKKAAAKKAAPKKAAAKKAAPKKAAAKKAAPKKAAAKKSAKKKR